MTRTQKLVTAIVVCSYLFSAVFMFQGFMGDSAPSISSPAATFNKQSIAPNPGRTLRPDGQTEKAEVTSMLTFSMELGDLCPELRQPVFSLDYAYISPTEQTAKMILRRAFRKLENVYVADAYDCDDNATELMILLRKEALVEYREYPAALAIGFVGVRIDGPIYEYRPMGFEPDDYPLYHAMVIMRIKDGHWLLIEPLTHQVCELTGPIFEGQIGIELLYF
jgi:hypothetical protein